MVENDSVGSTPQFSPQLQIPHHIQTREGSDGLDLEEHSSESTVANKTDCVLITRKFPTTNLSDHRLIWNRHSRNRCWHPIEAYPCWVLRCGNN
jgi:hypothetical protein